MNRTRQFSVVLALLLSIAACSPNPVTPSSASAGAGDAVAAKGGGKPPSSVPATAVFRCNDDSCAESDRIRGDGSPYPAQIGSDGNLMLQLPDSSRHITFDYAECVAPCPTGRRWFATYEAGHGQAVLIHTSVLVPGTETEVSGGMLAIPIGATWSSRIKMGYKAINPAGQAFTWGNRFNPFFPGSTNLSVTRVSENEWHIEATRAQRAWTVSIGGGTKPRDVTEVFEGNYLMPFRIIVTK